MFQIGSADRIHSGTSLAPSLSVSPLQFEEEGDMSRQTKVERKFLYLLQVTWRRRPPCLYMVKPLKYLLQNYLEDCFETWCVAFGTLELQNVYKRWPWVDLHSKKLFEDFSPLFRKQTISMTSYLLVKAPKPFQNEITVLNTDNEKPDDAITNGGQTMDRPMAPSTAAMDTSRWGSGGTSLRELKE